MVEAYKMISSINKYIYIQCHNWRIKSHWGKLLDNRIKTEKIIFHIGFNYIVWLTAAKFYQGQTLKQVIKELAKSCSMDH